MRERESVCERHRQTEIAQRERRTDRQVFLPRHPLDTRWGRTRQRWCYKNDWATFCTFLRTWTLASENVKDATFFPNSACQCEFHRNLHREKGKENVTTKARRGDHGCLFCVQLISVTLGTTSISHWTWFGLDLLRTTENFNPKELQINITVFSSQLCPNLWIYLFHDRKRKGHIIFVFINMPVSAHFETSMSASAYAHKLPRPKFVLFIAACFCQTRTESPVFRRSSFHQWYHVSRKHKTVDLGGPEDIDPAPQNSQKYTVLLFVL